MALQALIVGLGQFGMSLARALSERRAEVLAVDVSQERVRTASSFVTQASEVDATDTDALARLSPERRDVCVCAIGDSAKDASIICTALLRQFGAPRVIARANNDIHARILSLVGAHQVINPEREFGERFASQVLHPGVLGELALGQGVLVTEAKAPSSFVGHTLSELMLPSRFGVTIVALRKRASGAIVLPKPDTKVEHDDELVVVAKDGALSRMLERS